MFEEPGKGLHLSSLDHRKILRALQIPGHTESPEQDPALYASLEEQIRLCEEEVLRCAAPRAVYRILHIEDIRPLLIGDDICRLLDDCSEAVLMALTLGNELEKRLMVEEVTNMSNAYLLDVCASQAVEEAADLFEGRLREEILSSGKYLTNRYSPGYGDYPLDVQRLFLEYLNAGRAIGLALTPTNLMTPRKSITALLGISRVPKPDVHGGCAHCPLLAKCSWLGHGEHCWDS